MNLQAKIYAEWKKDILSKEGILYNIENMVNNNNTINKAKIGQNKDKLIHKDFAQVIIVNIKNT